MTMNLPTDKPSNLIPMVSLHGGLSNNSTERQSEIGRELVSALQRFGFVGIKDFWEPQSQSHWIPEAFVWSKNLFGLSHEDKMKAPHPAGAVPHRGYSPPASEKVYGNANDADEGGKGGKEIRQIVDYKESYESGHPDNKTHYNIWLPEETLPGFKSFMLALNENLDRLCSDILETIILGLKLTCSLTPADADYLRSVVKHGLNNQLRLAHYPRLSASAPTSTLTRMSAHTDWSLFTLLFQDGTVGGLELQDPLFPGHFVPATPEAGTLVLNVGDSLMRFTNAFLPAALHRVTIPAPITPSGHASAGSGAESNDQANGTAEMVTRERYSIPYFYAPNDEALVKVLPSLLEGGREKRFEDVLFKDYGALRAKYAYLDEGEKEQT